MSANEGRAEAVLLLIEVLYRALNPAEHADIEAWIDLRSENEGGFLWLANAMYLPPLQLTESLNAVLHATPKERVRLRRRLQSFNDDLRD